MDADQIAIIDPGIGDRSGHRSGEKVATSTGTLLVPPRSVGGEGGGREGRGRIKVSGAHRSESPNQSSGPQRKQTCPPRALRPLSWSLQRGGLRKPSVFRVLPRLPCGEKRISFEPETRSLHSYRLDWRRTDFLLFLFFLKNGETFSLEIANAYSFYELRKANSQTR